MEGAGGGAGRSGVDRRLGTVGAVPVEASEQSSAIQLASGSISSGVTMHLAHPNLEPTPYRWKAPGAAILEKLHRARVTQAKAVL